MTDASGAGIDRIVVLMLENRSFDHLFGEWPGADGIVDRGFSNRLKPSAPPDAAANAPIAAGQPGQFTVAQGQGPGHSLHATNLQLYGVRSPAAGAVAQAVDDRGFVQDYKVELGADGVHGAAADLAVVMQTFAVGQLPALTSLAQNFVLCDRWHSEVPGPTMPNRFYMHAATSAGWAHNNWTADFALVTIYEQLHAAGHSWSVYCSDQNEVAQFSRINTQTANFKLFETAFAADAASGKLADYSFIIPRFSGSTTDGPANSMHSPQDVRPGDQLVADIYAALRASPGWPSMLFVVTFDEHGGYFDHVLPPPAVSPDGIASPAPGDTASFAPDFAFDRLGLRVPTILASPLLPKGVVCSTPLQHTSLLATVRKLFGIAGSLTRRDAAAPTFENLFLAAARTDAPLTLASEPPSMAMRMDPAEAPTDDVVREIAEQWRAKTGGLPGAPRVVVRPTTQDGMHRFLREQVQTYLAYRAGANDDQTA